MRKSIKQLIYILSLLILLSLPYFVFAADNNTIKTLRAVGEINGGYARAEETSAAAFAGKFIKAFLSLLGVMFLILMLYAGYNWMIAHGDEQKVTKAKDTLRTSIIGLAIILSAYAIYSFVLLRIIK